MLAGKIFRALTLSLLGSTCLLGAAFAQPSANVRDEVAELDAKTEAKASVLVLHATNSGKGIDPKIPARAREKLEKPPFSSYDSYELLDKADVAFSTQTQGELALPNGGKLTLKLNGVEDKFDVTVTISKPGGKKFLSLNAKAPKGELFFVAGPKHGDGVLVLGLEFLPK